MKKRSIALGICLSAAFCSTSASPVPESIGTSRELRANIYFPMEKGPERTKLIGGKELSTVVLFRTQSSSAMYLAMVEYAYCSGGASSVELTSSSQAKSTRSVKIKMSDVNKNFNHVIADAMCKDYAASGAASPSIATQPRPATQFRSFNDAPIFETTLIGDGVSARVSYRGSGKVDGADVIADITGTNHRSDQSTMRTFKVPKALCETGTGQALVSDGRRGWTDAITLNNRKPARYYATNDLTLGIVDGICVRSGNISLLKNSPVVAGSSNRTGAQTGSPAAKTNKPLTMGELTQCTHEWVKAFNEERGEEGPIAVDQLDEWEQWCKQGKRPD